MQILYAGSSSWQARLHRHPHSGLMPESHFDPRMPGHHSLELQEVCPVTRAIHGGSRLLARLQPVIASIRVEFEDVLRSESPCAI